MPGGIKFYTSVCSAYDYHSANHMKFIHKVRDNKRKVKFNFRLYHSFCSGILPLFILSGNEGIHALWTYSSILFLLSRLIECCLTSSDQYLDFNGLRMVICIAAWEIIGRVGIFCSAAAGYQVSVVDIWYKMIHYKLFNIWQFIKTFLPNRCNNKNPKFPRLIRYIALYSNFFYTVQ